MGIRRSHALCLALLATLSVVEASAETHGFEVTAGKVELVFSAREASSLPLEIDVIAENQCTKRGTSVPVGQCRLKIGTQGEGLRLVAEVSSSTPLGEGAHSLLWRVTDLGTLSFNLVESSCGIWEVSLIFDGIDSQTTSMMLLHPSSQNPGQGLMASVLKMRVRLHLFNQFTAQTIEYPLVLGIVVGGPWALASSPPSTTPPNLSNLTLLPDKNYRCFPVMVLESPEEWDGSLEGSCQFCFEGRESSVDDSPDDSVDGPF